MNSRTGLFFTHFQGERLKDFPGVLAGILERDNVYYYDAVYESSDGLYYLAPLPEELLVKVHSPEMVQRVKLWFLIRRLRANQSVPCQRFRRTPHVLTKYKKGITLKAQ
jgi:hypothetical protein